MNHLGPPASLPASWLARDWRSPAGSQRSQIHGRGAILERGGCPGTAFLSCWRDLLRTDRHNRIVADVQRGAQIAFGNFFASHAKVHGFAS
jgi:hypothetical protein